MTLVYLWRGAADAGDPAGSRQVYDSVNDKHDRFLLKTRSNLPMRGSALFAPYTSVSKSLW
jgi:hypothetical protein